MIVWGVTVWAWAVALLAAIGVVAFGGDDTEAGTPKAAAWGVLLASLAYIGYTRYTAADVSSLFSWVFGDGLIWIGLALVAFIGYSWQQASQESRNRDQFLDNMRNRVRAPMMTTYGIVTAVVITAFDALFLGGTMAAELIGFFGGLFASSPLEISNVFTIVLGYITLGGEVPLLDAYLPERLRNLGTVYWLGITLAVLGVSKMVTTKNFMEGLRS